MFYFRQLTLPNFLKSKKVPSQLLNSHDLLKFQSLGKINAGLTGRLQHFMTDSHRVAF